MYRMKMRKGGMEGERDGGRGMWKEGEREKEGGREDEREREELV